MATKIINNQRIDLTEQEWTLYQEICRSYDRPNFKGEELFRDLFETDDQGLIVFIKPPSNRFTSMEVVLFIMSVFQHQHIRLMHKKVDNICEELKNKVEKFTANK